MANQSDDLFSRWSRRKQEARRRSSRLSEDQSAEEQEAKTAKLTEDEGLSDLHEPEISLKKEEGSETRLPATDGEEGEDAVELDESDFDDVDFEKLDFDSDYSRFMQKGVPEAIRRKALRKLWRSNPILANLDGMNDYDEDFTDAALVVEGLKSAYQVGRGYMTQDEVDALDDEAEETPAGELTEEVAQTEIGEDGGDDHGDGGEIEDAENLGSDRAAQTGGEPDGEKSG